MSMGPLEYSVPAPPLLRKLITTANDRLPRRPSYEVFEDQLFGLLGDFRIDDRMIAQVLPERFDAEQVFNPTELQNGGIAFAEVVPFAWKSTGSYYGYLTLAEEIPATDWPVVGLDPVGGVFYMGADTKSGIESRAVNVSGHRRLTGESPTPDAHAAALVAALGLTPSHDSYSERQMPMPAPLIPAGYRYASHWNNVGVLAPASTFDDTFDLNAALDDFDQVEFALARLIGAGVFGTALNLAHAIHWLGDDAAKKNVLEQRIRIYASLGRPTMARRTKAQLDDLVANGQF